MPRKSSDHKLIAGPYARPLVRKGDVLYCERFGEVLVTGFTSRLRWPCTTRYGMRAPILTNELIRAVRTESVLAISHWWQVSRSLANDWRKCLSVPRVNPGTLRLRRFGAFTDEERARSFATLRKRRYRLAAGRRLLERWATRGRMGKYRKWTEEELALLGTMPDTEIARRTKRTTVAVVGKRREVRTRAAKIRKSR